MVSQFAALVASAAVAQLCMLGCDDDDDDGAAAGSGCLVVDGDVRASAVWKKLPGARADDAPDVCVQRDVVVERGAHLVIEPGVRVAFAAGASLVVARAEGAALTAAGTEAEPIVLRGAAPGAGSWDGVDIASADPRNEISFVEIRGAGAGGAVVADDTLGGLSAALVLDAEPGSPARAKVANVTISDSAGWGLVVEWISEASGLTGNRFVRNAAGAVVLSPPNVANMDATTSYEGNGFDGVAITGSPNLELAAPTVWRPLAPGATYWVREPIEILSDFTLAAGTTLVFAAGAGLTFPQNTTNSRAQVSFAGTAEAPVTLRGEQPRPGFWKGVEIQTGHATNLVAHAVIGHAETGLRVRKAGAFPAAALAVANTRIHDSATCAIESTSPDNTLTVTDTTFESNAADRCP